MLAAAALAVLPWPPATVPKLPLTTFGKLADPLSKPPPPIVADCTPAPTLLLGCPPIRLCALPLTVAGSNRKPRTPSTWTSKAAGSVVPMKFVPGVVPALPVRPQPAPPPPLAALVWIVPSGNLIPPVVDSMIPATVSGEPAVVVPMPTFPPLGCSSTGRRRLSEERKLSKMTPTSVW